MSRHHPSRYWMCLYLTGISIVLMIWASGRGYKWFVDLTGGERGIQYPPAPEVTFATPMKENKTMILLLTYFRSGSSFTADIVQQHPDIFYFFEPIFTLFQRPDRLKYYRIDTVCNMIDGKCRTPTETNENLDFLLKTMSSLFMCDFKDLPYNIKHYAFESKKSHAIKSTRDECSKKQKHFSATCLQNFELKCRKSITAIKVIRFTAETVALFLHKFPNLKVVHLIRDPRGMISSRREHDFRSEDIKTEATEVCRRYIRDIEVLRVLDQIFPGRIKPIVYEAIAENPIEAAKNLYNFLGLNFTSAIETSIMKHTTTSVHKSGYYGIHRENPTEVAYDWKHKLNSTEVQVIDSVCGALYQIAGFNAVNITSEMNITDFQTRRNVPDFGNYLRYREGKY